MKRLTLLLIGLAVCFTADAKVRRKPVRPLPTIEIITEKDARVLAMTNNLNLFAEAAFNHLYCFSQRRVFISAVADDLYLVAALDAGSDDIHQALLLRKFVLLLLLSLMGIKYIIQNI